MSRKSCNFKEGLRTLMCKFDGDGPFWVEAIQNIKKTDLPIADAVRNRREKCGVRLSLPDVLMELIIADACYSILSLDERFSKFWSRRLDMLDTICQNLAASVAYIIKMIICKVSGSDKRHSREAILKWVLKSIGETIQSLTTPHSTVFYEDEAFNNLKKLPNWDTAKKMKFVITNFEYENNNKIDIKKVAKNSHEVELLKMMSTSVVHCALWIKKLYNMTNDDNVLHIDVISMVMKALNRFGERSNYYSMINQAERLMIYKNKVTALVLIYNSELEMTDTEFVRRMKLQEKEALQRMKCGEIISHRHLLKQLTNGTTLSFLGCEFKGNIELKHKYTVRDICQAGCSVIKSDNSMIIMGRHTSDDEKFMLVLKRENNGTWYYATKVDEMQRGIGVLNGEDILG